MERDRVPAPGEAFVRYRSTILSLLIVSPLLACLFIGSLPARATQLAIFESVEPPFVEGPYLFKNQDLAQSFTATMNYELIRVQAMVHDLDPTQPVDPLDLSIETNSAGVPSGTVLATSRADGDFGYNWLMFDLTAPVNVTAGQTYWIVLEDNNGMSQQSGYKWAVKGADTYPRGVYAIRSGGGGWVPSAADDLLFRTWGIDGPQIAAGITVDSSTAGVWDPLTYTMCFNNTGTRAATYVWANVSLSPNTTYLSDTAAAVGGTALGPLSWQFTDVAVGAHNFHVDVRVNPGIFDGLPILAALRIDYANQTEALQERTNASVTVIARAPSLAVTKTVTPRFLAPGDNVTYTIGVVNSGSRPSPWVWVNDSLPPEVTYVSDTAAILANFTSKSFDGIVLHVLLTDLPQGSYAFDILARAEFGLRNGTAFTNTVNVDFADRRGVRVVPSPTAFATARIGGASILVAKTANVTSAPPGGEVRYRVRYDNRGNASARTLWINDSLPAEVDYVSDSGGGSYSTGVVRFVFQNVSVGLHSLTITARIRNGTTDGTIVQNIVTLAYSDWDGSPGPGSSSYVDVLAAQPVVSVRLSGPAVANPGDHQNVVVRIANWGNGTAGAVWVNLSLPSTVVRESDNASVFGGTATPTGWTFASVTPGTFSFDVRVRVVAGLANGTAMNFTAALDYLTPAGGHASAAPSTLRVSIIAPIFDLSLAFDRDAVPIGETVGFVLRYANTGLGVASDVWINLTLPEDVSVANASEAWIATTGQRFVWRETVVATGIRELRVTLRPDPGRAPGPIVVDATLSFTDANGNPAGSRTESAAFRVLSAAWTVQTWAFIVLLVAVALLSLFIGYRVYGFGTRDKARIVQLFLLHKSGLLVKHYSRTLTGNLDSDILGAMLVAVQNFVRESFRFKAGDLEEMTFGVHKILLVHGQFAIIAALVSGRYLDRLKVALRTGVERLEETYGDVLRDWSGVIGDFDGMDRLMDQVLSGRPAGRNGEASTPRLKLGNW